MKERDALFQTVAEEKQFYYNEAQKVSESLKQVHLERVRLEIQLKDSLALTAKGEDWRSKYHQLVEKTL